MHLKTSAFSRFFRHATTTLLGFASVILPAHAGDTYKWTVQYLIDNSETVYGKPQTSWPRQNRGLAISPDGKFLYTGYNHASNGQGEVRKIAIGISDDFARATTRVLSGPQGKAITTDDKGRVFIASGGEIFIYDANLSQVQLSVQTALCEGIATVRDGNELFLYGVERQIGRVRRWVLAEKDGVVVSATPSASFGEAGEIFLKFAQGLRGAEVDSKGRLWVADFEGARVYRVSKDGKNVEQMDLDHPMDIGFDGDRAFITRGADRVIAVFETESMKLLGNLAVPWDELELNPSGNNRTGGLSCIVTVPGKGFFVTNESGQTLNQKSTYGRADTHSDVINGKLYRDAFMDDNEPILQALVVPDGK